MTIRSLIAAGLFSVGALTCSGLATPAAAQGYTPEQQQLCQNDAFRLCGDAIPDVERVKACMIARRALLSPGCKSVFGVAPVEAAPVVRGRPTELAPRRRVVKETARPAKPAKGKKKPRRDDDD